MKVVFFLSSSKEADAKKLPFQKHGGRDDQTTVPDAGQK
jgi:hypothetical protein